MLHIIVNVLAVIGGLGVFICIALWTLALCAVVPKQPAEPDPWPLLDAIAEDDDP